MRTLALLCLLLLPAALRGQTDYRNLDAGRPVRVEDTEPTELYEMEFLLPTLRLERVNPGFYRWRVEPQLSYGVLPHLELSLRAPFVYREGAVTPRGGLAGVGMGGTYELNTETLHLPAMALGVEFELPVGPAAAPVAATSVRALVTRTMLGGRVHFNGSFGNFGVVVPPVLPPPVPGDTTPPPACPPGTARNTDGVCVTIPPDFPCVVAASPGRHGTGGPLLACAGGSAAVSPARRARALATPASLQQQVIPDPTVATGTRWSAGLGADRAFPLHSLALLGDVFAEKLNGIGRPVEWTGELGARQQLGVRTVIDAGVSRRFTGPSQGWQLNAGVTYVFPVPQGR